MARSAWDTLLSASFGLCLRFGSDRHVMSHQDLEHEVRELKKRLVHEKAEMDTLRTQNVHLAAQLHGTIKPDAQETSLCPPSIFLGYCIFAKGEKSCNVFWLGRFFSFSFAAYIYDYLKGEAHQEIRHSAVEVRRNPELMLKVLEEAYGHPPSLVKAQKQFFDRKQREVKGLREYSHALLSLAAEVSCGKGGDKLCGEESIKHQFAENVRDVTLCRELRKLLRQDPRLSLKKLCGEAILLADDDIRGRTAYTCEAAAERSAQPDPILLELREAMRRQDNKMEALAKEVA